MDDTQAALPPLPDPDDGWHSYTAEQMREYAMAAATEAGMRAFEEGWNKHKSLAATAPAGEPAAWMTMTEEGDPAMLFFDRAEAVQYCDDGEQPTPLYEAAPAATPSSYPGIPDNSSAAALGSLHAVACRLRLSGVDDDIAASLAQQISDAAAALGVGTPNHAARLRDAADAVMAHQWSAPKPAMHALQVLIDTAHAVADQQGTAVTGTPAVALPVEQVFMPSGWLVVREDGMDKFLTESETVADGFVHNGWGKSPLYDQAALDAAVAAERARLAQDVADLHMAQSVNNQNYPADWHDGVDAALAVIRGA